MVTPVGAGTGVPGSRRMARARRIRRGTTALASPRREPHPVKPRCPALPAPSCYPIRMVPCWGGERDKETRRTLREIIPRAILRQSVDLGVPETSGRLGRAVAKGTILVCVGVVQVVCLLGCGPRRAAAARIPEPRATVAVESKSASSRRPLFTEPAYLSYRFQELLKQSVGYKLFLLGAFTVPLIAFFGAVYSASTGLPIGTSMFKSYAAIVNAPGVDVMSDVTEHKNVVSAVWINLCFFAGLLTFAVFLGLIVADIEDRLYEMRNSSAYPLYEQNHTLILNWNRYTLPILKSLDGNGHVSMGRGKRKQAVVVIANKAKEEMDSLIEREGVGQSHHGAKIITRSGCPTDRDTLRRAAAGKASSVIILQNDDRELDVCSDATELEDFSQEVGSLLSLNSLKGRDLSIVLQSSSNVEVGVLAPREDKHPLSLARKVARDASTKNDRIVILAGRDIFGRLLASSALQPDYLPAFEGILRAAVSSQLLVSDPLPWTSTWGELRNRHPDRVLLGIERDNGFVPFVHSQDPVLAGDRIVQLLAPEGKGRGWRAPRASQSPSGRRGEGGAPTMAAATLPRRIGVLNTTASTSSPVHKGVLDSLLRGAPADAEITLIGTEKPRRGGGYNDQRIRHRTLPCFTHESLSKATRGLDSLIVLSDYGKPKSEQDSKTQLLALMLFDTFKSEAQNPSVTFSVHDVNVIERLRQVYFAHISGAVRAISPVDVISDLYLVVSRDPGLNEFFHHLLASEALKIVEAPRSARYSDFAGSCLSGGNVLVGYIDANSGRVIVNPSRKATEVVPRGSKLILYSERME